MAMLEIYFLIANLLLVLPSCKAQEYCFTDMQVVPKLTSSTTISITWNRSLTSESTCDGKPLANKLKIEHRLIILDHCKQVEPEVILDHLSDGSLEHLSDGSRQPYEIKSLTPYSQYAIYLTLLKDNINSPVDVITIYGNTTEAEASDIGIPANIKNPYKTNTSLGFTWDNIPCGQRRALIIQYDILLICPDPQLCASRRGYQTVMKVDTYFDDLSPATEYTFQIRSVASIGNESNVLGNFSEMFPARTLDTTDAGLCEPLNLNKVNADLKSITVTWDSPATSDACNGVNITGYVILYYPTDKNGSEAESITVSEHVGVEIGHRYELQNLTNHTTYMIQVRVNGLTRFHAAVHGGWSTIKVTTEEGRSSKPRNVTVDVISHNSLTLKWNKPLNPNGVIAYYEIQYKPIMKIVTSSQPIETRQHSNQIVECRSPESLMGVCTITNLEPKSEYEIKISANKEERTLPGLQAVIYATTSEGIFGVGTIAGIGGAIGVLILLVGIIIFVAYKRKMLPSWRRLSTMSLQPLHPNRNLNGEDVLIDTLPEVEYMNVRPGGLIVIDPTYWDLQWKDLNVGTLILGHGNFGEIREGMVKKGATWTRVAIKTLPDGAPETEMNNFARELESMKKIGRHINIVSLVGSVRHNGQLYVALEHGRHGDLLNFLKNSRLPEPDENGRLSTLTSSHLLGFGLDVAKGMKMLADQGLIHRDLAARNILVGQGPDGLIAKVSDFGMTRGDLIYYQKSDLPVPVKWTALESLTMLVYTTHSDVWSFGILLWEIVTYGETPYKTPTNIENRDLTLYLQQGYRLPKPPNCDTKLYDVMAKCWKENTSDRPNFETLVTKLTQLLDDESVYVITEIPGNLRIADRDLF